MIDDIGALYTSDPALGDGPCGIIRNAWVVVDDGQDRGGRQRRAAGGRSRDRCRRDVRAARLRRQPQPPRLRRRPHRRVRSPHGRPALRGRRHHDDGRSDPRGADDGAARRPGQGAGRARRARSGTTTIEIKCGLRPRRRHRGRVAPGGARRSPTETTFLGAHVVPAEFAGRADDYVALVCGEMLDRVRAARPVDRRVLRAGRVRRRPVPRRARRRPRAPGSACGCTPTSSAPATGVQLAVEPAARRPTTARTSPTPTSSCSPGATRSRRSCRPPTSRPASRIPTRGG